MCDKAGQVLGLGWLTVGGDLERILLQEMLPLAYVASSIGSEGRQDANPAFSPYAV